MRKFAQSISIMLVLVCLGGCRTMAPVRDEAESSADVQEAITAVAGALSGRELNEEEKSNLKQQIRTDKEAQSAIQAISGSVSGKDKTVKYCPLTGERYAPHLETCPVHGVPLEWVDP